MTLCAHCSTPDNLTHHLDAGARPPICGDCADDLAENGYPFAGLIVEGAA